ncbi:Septin-4 [Cichlidogyrus casuarinus]|uniref:Septin-4 n=1 Tax=Cichlidogyrus casuarinus TaxID=1844966 RepID=A0ABD2QFW9_9PLAT
MNRNSIKSFIPRVLRPNGKSRKTFDIQSLYSSSRVHDSSSSDIAVSLTDIESSIVSEIIRDRKNCFARKSSGASTPSTSCAVDYYMSALEEAEKDLMHKTPLTQSYIRSNTLQRRNSFYDTSRKKRAMTHIARYLQEATDLNSKNSKLAFSGLSEQMKRKAVKKGFNFTLMVVGESGLGKSTLVNSLLMQELYKNRAPCTDFASLINKTTQIEKRQIEIDERGVKLKVTIVDTPGFGDAVNCEHCFKPIEDYIDGTFEQFFKDESGLNRKNIQDNRVHCCLYFVSPISHGLRPLDVQFMKRLHNKVNIVPVIAKADTLTLQELHQFKERLREDLERYGIESYRLPECDSDEEDEVKRLEKDIKAVLPFAVIGSNCYIETESGKKVRGRQYPWGTVEVENGKHCDFSKLRLFLLKTHMQDLKDMTSDGHYESYRAKYITERISKRNGEKRMTPVSDDTIISSNDLLKQKEEELRRMQQEMSHLQEQLKKSSNNYLDTRSSGSLLSGSRTSVASSAQAS